MKNIVYKYDFEFLIDKVTREALAINILKKKLECIGYKVKISHQDTFTRPGSYNFFYNCKESAKLIITPSFNVRRTKSLVAKAILQKSKIVVMHSEQLFPSIFDEEKLNIKDRDIYNLLVESHLCWGDFYKDKLKRLTNTDPKKIYVTGNYKFEFLKSKEDIKEDSITNILAVSNFTLADYNFSQWENFKISHQIQTEYQLHESYRKIRFEFVKIIRSLCEAFPNITFKMRPHPGEDQSIYFDVLNGIDNIIIDNRQEMSEDIKKCQLVLMHSSSSIFECLLANKRVLSIGQPMIPNKFMQTPTNIFEWYSLNEVKNVIKNRELAVSQYQVDILMSLFPMKGNVFDKIVEALVQINLKNNNYLQYDSKTFILFLSYVLEAISKDIFLKIGYFFKNVPLICKINKFAINHLKNRVKKQNFIPRRFTMKNPRFRDEVIKFVEKK